LHSDEIVLFKVECSDINGRVRAGDRPRAIRMETVSASSRVWTERPPPWPGMVEARARSCARKRHHIVEARVTLTARCIYAPLRRPRVVSRARRATLVSRKRLVRPRLARHASAGQDPRAVQCVTRFALRLVRELFDYKTSMITDEDPLRGLLFYQDLGFSRTLHVLNLVRRSDVARGRHAEKRHSDRRQEEGGALGHPARERSSVDADDTSCG